MNIAFAFRHSSSPIDKLYLKRVLRTSEAMVNAGHRVFVFVMSQTPTDLDLPLGVVAVNVETPDEDLCRQTWVAEHAYSDALASKILDFLNTQKLDFIEFPLWKGLGISLIRSKRLLNACLDTKISIYSNFSQAALESVAIESCDLMNGMVVGEMEAYCVRYADLVGTPLEEMKEVLRSKGGRSDIHLLSDDSAIADLASLSEGEESPCNCLKGLIALAQKDPSLALEQDQELLNELQWLEQPTRKRFIRQSKTNSITIVVPYSGGDSIDKLGAQFVDTQNLNFRIATYCASDEDGIREDFQRLNSDGLLKLNSNEEGVLSLREIVDQVSSEFVVFYKDGTQYAQNYLNVAVSALSQNSELSAVGSYISGVNIKQAIGNVPGLMILSNTCSDWGNVFRLNKLEQLLTQNDDLALCSDGDWSLLLSLIERYQAIDVLPFSGVGFVDESQGTVSIDQIAERERGIWNINQYSRLIGSVSIKLIKLLIKQQDSIWGKSGVSCREISLPLSSLTESDDPEHTEDGFDAEAGREKDISVFDQEENEAEQVEIDDESSVVNDDIPAIESIELNPIDELVAADDIAHPENKEEDQDNGLFSDIIAKEEEEIENSEESSEPHQAPESEEPISLPEEILSDDETVESSEELIQDPELESNDHKEEEIKLQIPKTEESENPDPIEGKDPLTEGTGEVGDSDTDEGKSTSWIGKLRLGKVKDMDDSQWQEYPSDSGMDKLSLAEETDTANQEENPEFEDEPQGLKLGSIESSDDSNAQAIESVEFADEVEDDPSDWFQVFWSEDGAYSEESSTKTEYNSSDTFALDITVEPNDAFKFLRLDPCCREGKVVLKRIEIWNNSTHMPIYTSSEENAFDNIMPGGDFEVEGIELDSLELISNGADPQILLELEESINSSVTLSIEFKFERAE